VTIWTTGYTQGELDTAQEKYDLRFPPDMIELLLDRRIAKSFDWRTDHEYIRDRLRWPLEGMLFDVEENEFWLPDWGERPRKAAARREIVSAAVAAAPRLIPIYSHRYLPAEPHKTGNPVLSVYQTDIIYYGANLQNYLDNEFGPRARVGGSSDYAREPRRIRFWSDIIDGAGCSEN